MAGLWALAVVVVAVAGLIGLRFADVEVAADATVVGFSALTLAWALLPLLVFGVDETLDPARFVLLPTRARELIPGMLLAGLAGVPGVATVVVAAASVVTWSRGPAPVVAAVVAAILGVLTCALLARVLTSAFARVLRSRRFRDLATALLAVVAVSFGLGFDLALGSASARPDDVDALLAQLHRAADIASWTPFGWAWSLPGLVAEGHWVDAAVRLLLAGGLVIGLGRSWERLLGRNLTTPADLGGAGTRVRASAGLAERIYPDNPTGAVASSMPAVLAPRSPLPVVDRRSGGRARAVRRESDGRSARVAVVGRVRPTRRSPSWSGRR